MSYFYTDKQKPEILNVRKAAQTRIFEVQSVDLRFANGEERTYERLAPNRRPAVLVMPIDGDDLIMVREYAVGPERYELGFTKGLIDEGEAPEQSAKRELQEEIGFDARKITPLRMVYSSPSHMYAPMYIFVAEDLYPSQLIGDEPEPLEIVRIPLSKIDDLLNDVGFGESKHLSALFLLKMFLEKRQKA